MRTSILILAASALFQTPALAQQSVRQVVQVHDLDLASSTGRARLERRLAAALETVCGSYAGSTVQEADEITRCRAGARSQAEIRVAALRSRSERRVLGSR